MQLVEVVEWDNRRRANRQAILDAYFAGDEMVDDTRSDS